MIAKTDLRKLADYVLLNAYSVHSTGFYNGKAGLSLCLFEMAEMLEDAYLENHAFELLQEALLSNNPDASFQNGLAGIGYVLRYLIQNRFVEAEFDDFFGCHLVTIRQSLAGLSYSQKQTGTWMTTAYLLDDAATVDALVGPAYDNLCRLWEAGSPDLHKMNVFLLYTTMLKVLAATTLASFDVTEMLQAYTGLYRRGKAPSEFSTGYYMSLLARRTNFAEALPVAEQCMRVAACNCHPQFMTLSQRIRMLFLLRKDEDRYRKQIDRLEDGWMDLSARELEQALFASMHPNTFMAGYENGISLFLLYVSYVASRQAGKDVSRFDKLFK